MLFLAILGLIGLVAIALTVHAVRTDGYGSKQIRHDDGFAPEKPHATTLKGHS